MNNQLTVQTNLDLDLHEIFHSQKSYLIRLAIQKFKLCKIEAEELFTDALIILKENMMKGKLAHSEYIRAYVFGIMRNLWCKQQRVRLKEQRYIEITKHQSSAQVFLQSDEELKSELANTLCKLNDRHRKILELYYVHKLSLREIAEDLGYKSSAVVKNLKFRALQNCREVIGERCA